MPGDIIKERKMGGIEDVPIFTPSGFCYFYKSLCQNSGANESINNRDIFRCALQLQPYLAKAAEVFQGFVKSNEEGFRSEDDG